MKRRLFLSAVLAALLLLPATARAGLVIVGSYAGGDTSFNIATYEESGIRVGLLNISRKVSVTFAQNEWNSFVALWRKAERAQSDSFQLIGSFKESSTTYRSLLTVAAGPGVQFTINDAAGTLSFTLSPNDFARFDGDVATVAAFIGAN
ncbi:MAG TPA: hypothetical protein VFC38_09070 [Stellaceae bacterium]|nr:hypothetical protein [Stellaceae bacterium]